MIRAKSGAWNGSVDALANGLLAGNALVGAAAAGVGTAARELAIEIADDGFRPDLILSIARGGLFVAGSLGYALDVKNLHVMNVEFYTGVDERLDMPVMLPPVPQPVTNTSSRRPAKSLRISGPVVWRW